ncbi:MAG: hypothetical protein M3R52_00390 [Acidobacteriota bacterium]|nr:hypothetical protein [Acidobacteriota bacterium]
MKSQFLVCVARGWDGGMPPLLRYSMIVAIGNPTMTEGALATGTPTWFTPR